MTQVSRATWASSLTTLINDNTAGEISAADVRSILNDLEDSVRWYDEGEDADADILKSDTTATLTVGYEATPDNAGTQSSGTFTPDPADGNYQYAVNGGAHTLAPMGGSIAYNISLLYTNNGSAGAITTSGFDIVDGDDFDTTDTNQFICQIQQVYDGTSAISWLNVKAVA